MKNCRGKRPIPDRGLTFVNLACPFCQDAPPLMRILHNVWTFAYHPTGTIGGRRPYDLERGRVEVNESAHRPETRGRAVALCIPVAASVRSVFCIGPFGLALRLQTANGISCIAPRAKSNPTFRCWQSERNGAFQMSESLDR